MAESQNLSGLDGTQSVSALGLRWAALRGMLNSPLIMADEQRGLRDELLRELAAIEQDFSDLPSRTATEISAKLDIAKSALRERIQTGETWLVDLIESIQADVHAVNLKPSAVTAPTTTANRSPANLSRPQQQRSDETGTSSGSPSSATSTGSETTTSSAA